MAVAMRLVAVVAVAPVAMATIMAIPAVAGRWWRWRVVVASRVGVHWWSMGSLVHRLPWVPLVSLGGIALLLVGHTAANRGTGRATGTRTQHSAIAPTHGLAHRCACRTTNGTADYRTPLASPLGTHRGTGCPTDGAANDCTMAPTHLLAEHRTGRRAHAATHQGAQIVGVAGGAQDGQSQCTAGKQDCHSYAWRRTLDGNFQHRGLGALGPYRQT